MAVLRLPAVLMHADARDCRVRLVQGLASIQDRVVLLDASDLERFDSSALAVILACRREALALGRTLQVQGLPERLCELASLYGVLQWLQT
ncbi:MAG: lipid asymmetry maintenance protein MlaB [Limnohabitans sp.]